MLENRAEGLLCCVMEKLVSVFYELCPPTKVSNDEVLSFSALESNHIWIYSIQMVIKLK